MRAAERGSGQLTVQTEWFPQMSASFPKSDLRRGEETPLDTEMRLFGSATRWAFNRLLEGRMRAELKVLGQGVFHLNSRYIDDAILKAQEIIDSQKALIPIEIEETEAKIGKTEKKIKRITAKAKKLEVAGHPEEAGRERRRLPGLEARQKRLRAKLAAYRGHQRDGTIPKVVFGGRRLWRRVTRGQASRVQWRAARRSHLYARKDTSRGGNLNLRLGCANGGFRLDAALSHLAPEGHAPRLFGTLFVPETFQLALADHILSGKPYTVELIHGQDGRYRAHISLEPAAVPVQTDFTLGVLGIDTNPDGLALASIDREGKPQALPENFTIPYPKALGKYPGEVQIEVKQSTIWLGVPELRDARGDRRDYLIGVVAATAVSTAQSLGKGIALEALDFRKDHDTNKAFNRMSTNFPYGKMVEAIDRRAYKQGVAIVSVNPAYTSVIGHHKYQHILGGTVHEAAAFTIARRAEGRRERFTPALRQEIQALRQRLLTQAKTLTQDPASPAEGTGRVQAGILKRLAGSLRDERLLRHNGSSLWRQRGRASPWGALVELRRYAWAKPLLAESGETSVG